MHKFNKEFFKVIDCEEKAYILGFIYADGYNSDRQVVLTQLNQDKDILDKIKIALEADNEVATYYNYNGKESNKLAFSSVDFCDDLSKLNCVKNKSLTLSFPDDTIVPDDLKRHFIRGYFDGDGCIWNGKRKKMIVKDKTRSSGYRERIVHNVKFTFTGCVSFIEPLQEYLVNKLGLNKTKLNYSKAKNKNNNTSECICTMEYSGRGNIKKLFDFMYTDSKIYGDRKFNKFNEIFCASEEKSSEDTSLIAGTPEMAISSQASDYKSDEGSSTIPEMEVESSDSKCEALTK